MIRTVIISSFLSALFLTACNKDNPSPDNTVQPKYYWQASMDGQKKEFLCSEYATVNDQVNAASFSNPGDYHSYSSGFGIFDIGVSGFKNDHIYVSFTLPKAFPQETDYLSYFVTGSKSYATSSEQPGVYIYWVDPAGQLWTTYDGSQTGSSFEITKFEVDNAMAETNLVEASFSCKLYSGSESKTLTNGKVKGILFSYLE